jgi:hypothetical protein
MGCMSAPDPATEAAKRIAFCLRKGRDHLNLAGLGLTELPPDFVKLTGLRYLDLTGNQLTTLPDEVCTFTELRWLGLNFNRLSTLPADIGKLKNLERLYVRGNQLENLPETFGGLIALVELDLHENRVSALDGQWHQLEALTYIVLTGNPLSSLPPALGSLKRLQHVVLTPETLPADMRTAWWSNQWEGLKNHLVRLDKAEHDHFRVWSGEGRRFDSLEGELAVSLRKLCDRVETLSAYRKAKAELLEGLVGDARVRADSALIDWSADVSENVRTHITHTGKLVFIGDTGMGKTCLLRALKGEPFDEKSVSTQGMEVSRLRLRIDGGLVRTEEAQQDTDMVLHCWDMGGQEMYHHTHQIFFSDEAIYLGVIQAGKRASVRDLRHWLELLRTRTQKTGIHVIIAITASAGMPNADELERGSLQRDFPSFVFDFVQVDSDGRKTGGDGFNIAELRQKLARLAQTTANFGRNWLPGWAAAMEALTRHTEPYLQLETARQVCVEHQVIEPDQQELLLATAHEVGLLLWKRHMGAARDYIVLSPDWLSHAVARILVVADKQRWTGPVTREQLRDIWSTAVEKTDRCYTTAEMPLLVELMEAYEISYRGHAVRSDDAPDERFLIASMVADARPDYATHWPDGIPHGEVEAARFVSFELEDGELSEKDYQRIICHLIVRLHRFSLGVDDIARAIHWKSGLLIQHASEMKALITVGMRELGIRVRAGNPEGFLDIIMEAIGSGETGVIRNAEIVESAACWDECRTREVGKGRWPLRVLRKREAANETAFDCDKGNCERRLSLQRLLHPLAPEAAVDQKLSAINAAATRIEAQVSQLMDWCSISQMDKATLKRALDQQTKEIQHKMAQMLLQHFNAFLREMKMPGADGPRLFSIVPVEQPGFFSTSKWTEARFRLSLWCEHSQRPLSLVDGLDSTRGVREVTFAKPLLQQALPVLKWMVAAGVWVKGASALIAPEATETAVIASSVVLAEMTLMKELLTDLEKAPVLPADAEEGPLGTEWPAKFAHADTREHGIPYREMTAFTLIARDKYKAKDPTWGGMELVPNGPQSSIWVHPRFKEHYLPPKPNF